MTDDVVVLGPEAWPEIQRILSEESKLKTNEQALLLWFGVEAIEEFLQYPADVKRMNRETGLGMMGEPTARGLLEKMKAKLAELEKACSR